MVKFLESLISEEGRELVVEEGVCVCMFFLVSVELAIREEVNFISSGTGWLGRWR